ncbi:MAG: hypothetical protein Q4C25_03085 [Bacillota bacterium]|nr:hypothetical protein [Bacillota bacterium]
MTKDNNAKELLEQQKDAYLPLIEEERRAFIGKEHGRLQALVGTAYWIEETKESRYFHKQIEEGRERDLSVDPYEITIEELAMLPTLEKRVERLGTYSYFPLFQMFPQDISRLTLLAKIQRKLEDGRVCTDEEGKQLTEGHEDYLKRKMQDTVKVIKEAL